MNRRGFLASLLAAPVAAVAADPKRFVAPSAHTAPNRIEPGTEYDWREFGMSIEWDDADAFVRGEPGRVIEGAAFVSESGVRYKRWVKCEDSQGRVAHIRVFA